MNFKGFALALAAAVLALPAAAADLGDVKTPIRLALNNWTGQQISSYIVGGMLEHAGYTVEYIEADSNGMFADMATGGLHAAVEVWTTSSPEAYYAALEEGNVVSLGDMGLEARNGIVYPAFVSQMCPGLPKWEALRDCAHIFSKDGKGPKGRYLGYPATWGSPGADRMRALELPFEYEVADSEAAMIEEFRAAMVEKRPVIATFWQPHWAMSSYALQFVRLPKPEPACHSDPAWGPNPKATGDCDIVRGGVVKAGWIGLKDKFPAAHEILSSFTLSIWDQQPLLGMVDVKGETHAGAAAGWLAVNRAKWEPLVDRATGKSGS
ncbi:ABC transporter substrate-binding protein [Cribrihabitans pelagius]|uniref:ABC transporter substrate-binding protein n=1 Tax=Cribrihabitans pelagius TaxID=1765746 RepID=UPI003B5BB8BA